MGFSSRLKSSENFVRRTYMYFYTRYLIQVIVPLLALRRNGSSIWCYDWLIDCLVFGAVSALFQPHNKMISFVLMRQTDRLQPLSTDWIFLLWWHISAITCQIIMLTCQIFMLTCQIFMLTCQIFMLTCHLFPP